MGDPHPRRVRATVGVAGLGLLVGHWLAYALAEPHVAEREALLRETGHGYLPYATQVAVLAAGVGIVSLFLGRLARERRGSFALDAARLAAAQSVAFVAMEVGERLASGAGLHDLTHAPTLAIGLAVQVAVAIAGAALLRYTDRAADRAIEISATSAPPAPAILAVSIGGGAVPPARPAMRAPSGRAPPSPA